MKPIEWKTEKRKLSDLIPYDINPRKLSDIQHDQLKRSLEKFNLAEIPAITKDNRLLAGHQRSRVLAELKGADFEIDVRVPNRELSKAEEKEYLVRSNKNTGEWDFNLLDEFFDKADLLEWGFEDIDFKSSDNLDATAEWDGMPEFEMEDKTSFRQIIVHFIDDNGIKEFQKLINQKITDKTKMIWFPQIEIEKYADKSYE